MKVTWFLASLSMVGCGVAAEPSPAGSRNDDTYELQVNRESVGDSSDGSTSSSTDRDTIVERVVAVREDGLELEYDLPKEADAKARAADWQFPARVFKPRSGPTQLLNRAELEMRIDAWLKAAKWTREACGRWIFTWNAFRIECDPQSVLKTIEAFDLRSVDLRDGAPYQEKRAVGPAPLIRKAVGQGSATFIAELKIDCEAVRRERAESDVIIGEIMKEPVTLEAALQKRATEAIAGTISVTFDADSTGNARQRSRIAKVETKSANGVVETETVTETLERRPISQP